MSIDKIFIIRTATNVVGETKMALYYYYFFFLLNDIIFIIPTVQLQEFDTEDYCG